MGWYGQQAQTSKVAPARMEHDRLLSCLRCHLETVTAENQRLKAAVWTIRRGGKGPKKKMTKEERKANRKAKKAGKQSDVLSGRSGGTQTMVVYGGKKAVPIPPEFLIGEDGDSEKACRNVETEHVQKVYDTIALQWHGTRYKSWPKVADFIDNQVRRAQTVAGTLLIAPRQPPGSLFGDIGCGNGKNMPHCNVAGMALVISQCGFRFVASA